MEMGFSVHDNEGSSFEARHPRCVSQITKLYSRRLKVKTQLYILYYIIIYYIIYIYVYIADDGNS